MKQDIVTRLWNRSESWEVDGVTDEFCIDAKLDREAADEIERLRKLVDEFAKLTDHHLRMDHPPRAGKSSLTNSIFELRRILGRHRELQK